MWTLIDPLGRLYTAGIDHHIHTFRVRPSQIFKINRNQTDLHCRSCVGCLGDHRGQLLPCFHLSPKGQLLFLPQWLVYVEISAASYYNHIVNLLIH